MEVILLVSLLISKRRITTFLMKEEKINRVASEDFVNAKPIRCDTCANGWVRISENGYCVKCTLSQKKATNCLIGIKSHYVERQYMRKEDDGK